MSHHRVVVNCQTGRAEQVAFTPEEEAAQDAIDAADALKCAEVAELRQEGRIAEALKLKR